MNRGSLCRLTTALVLVAGMASSSSAADRRFALVIGYNQSDDATLDDLSYADDDALRYAELLGHVADRVVTLTEPDRDSRSLWGELDDDLRPPTRAAVIAALSELRDDMDAARAAGDRPILYFFYSGHGNYDAEGRGYVHLAEGRFTTRDLYHQVIAPSQGDPVVLLVDSCNAALLVHSRGAGAERRVAGPTTLRLEDYPNVGVILASSSVGETHEWGKYLAGIFSHEVRSALLGPGDIDDDGQVTFAELAAFVAAANVRVKNPTVRLQPYVRPPLTEPNLALIDLDTARFPARVRMDGPMMGKAHLVDEDLVRHADFHRLGEQGFWLALPRRGAFVIVRGDLEHLVPAGTEGSVSLADLPTRERTVLSARGAGSAYFDRTLFQEAYGRQFAGDYLSDAYLESLVVRRLVPRPWYDNVGAWGVLASGAAAVGAGVGFHAAALDTSRDASRAWAHERPRLNRLARDYEAGAAVLYGVGGAALVTGIVWFVLDQQLQEERYDPPIRVDLTPTGILLRADL